MKTAGKMLLFAALVCAFATSAAASGCGSVSIAEMKWGSAAIAANFDRIILEAGYGCDVKIVPGDTMPTFASMNGKSTPDVAPELWVKGVQTELDDAITAGRLVEGAEILSEGAVEGLWIPKFVADANPSIRTLEDALARPDLFPGDGSTDKAAIFNCPTGWACKISTQNIYNAFHAEEKGFDLIGAETPRALDASIADAFADKRGWLGYYWAPTAVAGKYEMVRLEMGVPFDQAEWDNCTSVPGCAKPERNAYPTSQAFTVTTRLFADRAGPAMDYLRKRRWDNGTINDVLAWQDENGESSRNAAIYFLQNYPELWTLWVPEEVAARVKRAL